MLKYNTKAILNEIYLEQSGINVNIILLKVLEQRRSEFKSTAFQKVYTFLSTSTKIAIHTILKYNAK